MNELYGDGELVFHEICRCFPEMSKDQFENHKGDIEKCGQRESVTLYEDQILDGRHRALALRELGLPIKTEVFVGTWMEALALATSRNDCRRHATVSQRAMTGANIAEYISRQIKEDPGSKPGPRKASAEFLDNNNQELKNQPRDATKEAAKKVGVSRSYVRAAQNIKSKSPEVAADVKAGKTTIQEAKKALGIGSKKAYKNPFATPAASPGKSRVNGQLTNDPPDIARQRASGKIPEGTIPTVDIPENPTDTAAIAEEIEEEAAKKEENIDEWIRSLPYHDKLGSLPKKFLRDDCVAYLALKKPYTTWKNSVALHTKRRRRHGPYIYWARNLASVDPPEEWILCAPLKAGGCNGAGIIDLIGQCPMCHGCGYRINTKERKS